MRRRLSKARRRGYGIGSKWRRGRIWWVKVFDGKGKPIRKSTGSQHEADADDLLGQLLRERSRGELAGIASSGVLNLEAALRDMAKRRPMATPALPYFPMESERDNVRLGFISQDDFEKKLNPDCQGISKPLQRALFSLVGTKVNGCD